MSDEPHHIPIPEPASHVESGFLTQFWESKEPLPQIQGAEKLWYYLQRGVDAVFALPMSNTIAVMTVAVSLFLFSGFLLLVHNLERILLDAGSNLAVTAYIKEGVPENNIRALEKALAADAAVQSARATTKSGALEDLRRDLGERASLLEGLGDENPLPASIDVIVQPGKNAKADVERVVVQLRATEIVDEVLYGSEWFEKMQGVLRVFRFFGMALSMAVLAIVVFLISNTIRLVIYSRRDEIEVMQLVGAADTMIQLPFFIGGAIQGFVGSVLGVLLLRLGFAVAERAIEGNALFGLAIPSLEFFQWPAIAALVSGGVIIGAVASLFALGRHMNV